MAMTRVLCLLALVGCATALPSSPAHLRASPQQPMRLKGGWLNEKQVLNTQAVLNGCAGVSAICNPKQTLEIYGIPDTTPMENNFYQWLGIAAIEVGTVVGMTNNGFSLHEALGAQAAIKALFFAHQIFTKGGIVDLAGIPSGPLILWMVLHSVTAILCLTDGAGTGIDLDNVAKFWGIVNIVHALGFLLFLDTMMSKVYSLDKTVTPLQKSVLQISSINIFNLGLYIWMVVSGKSKAEAAMWMATTGALLFGKMVATQEWRAWKASNGVGPAAWFAICSLLGYNVCRIVRNIK